MGGREETRREEGNRRQAADDREEFRRIRQEIFARMDLTREISDEELRHMISREVRGYARQHSLSLERRAHMERQLFNSFRKLDILQELLDQPEITEILVNGYRKIFYEKQGRLYLWEKSFDSEETLMNIIQTIVGKQNRRVNEASPIVSSRLADGSRVHIILRPVSLDGASLSIRRFSRDPITMERLIRMHSISRQAARMLEILVQAGYNLFVSGGTGSGKTTFLNALSRYIPEEERVVTIEDAAELQLKHVPNLVRLETRGEGSGEADPITVRDLIRTALRMRPDRIIVGECRGGETLDMLQAINTGHSGSMSTGHGNSVADMLSRLETMTLMGGLELPIPAVRGQISHGLDLMVHLGRLRDHSRKLLDVQEIAGMEQGEIVLHPLLHFTEKGERHGKIYGTWEQQGRLLHREKLRAKGLEEAFRAVEQGKD
ncbi:MAG: CpaF family protein [Eubacterium sp.]|jgi:pilus assembly protein CpaF